MPANLSKPFAESCCDGGACSNEMSAQSCGCDAGAKWVCQRHQYERLMKFVEENNGEVKEALERSRERNLELQQTAENSTGPSDERPRGPRE